MIDKDFQRRQELFGTPEDEEIKKTNERSKLKTDGGTKRYIEKKVKHCKI